MNFNAAKKAIPTYRKIMYGFCGLIAAIHCAFLLLILPSLKLFGYPGITIPITFLALALPSLVMPFMYAIINGSMLISSGRYHVPLVVCALAAALSNVFIFSAPGLPVLAASIVLFIALFASSLCLQILLYLFNSIRVRMDEGNTCALFEKIFGAVGALVAIVMFAFMFDGSFLAIQNISFILSALFLGAMVVFYLGTYSCMPFFIRVEAASEYTKKQNYVRFIRPMAKPFTRRIYIGGGLLNLAKNLYMVSFGLLAAISVLPLNLTVKLSVIVFVILTFLGVWAFQKISKRGAVKRICFTVIFTSVVYCILGIEAVVMLSLNLQQHVFIICLITLCALFALGGAPLKSVQRIMMDKVRKETGVSQGNAFSLYNAITAITLGIAVALGTALVSLSFLGATVIFIIVASVASGSSIAGSILLFINFKRSSIDKIAASAVAESATENEEYLQNKNDEDA